MRDLNLNRWPNLFRHIRGKSDSFTIPWSPENEKIIQEAKTAVISADLEKALECLFKIDVLNRSVETTQLASRLNQHKKEIRQGINTSEINSISFNRLSSGILSLITEVEKHLKKEGEVIAKIKTYLIHRYKNRLSQKMAGRQPINLSKTPNIEGTTEETSSYFATLSNDDVQGEIKSIFEEAKGRLLITGVPGAGKTVVMLQLALALLNKKTNSIPVLLNLASWNSREHSKLSDWLEEILPIEMGVSTGFVKKILNETPLILLLDGLDEVDVEMRESCLDAIGKYGADPEMHFAIASRKQEYIETKKDAPVYCQIEIEPLKVEQIEAELTHKGYQQPGSLPLLKALKIDGLLKKVIETPFYFNILQLLFDQGKRLSDLKLKSKIKSKREEEITEIFISEQIQNSNRNWPSNKSRRWLSFLAYQMNNKNLITIELKNLSYDWCKNWSNFQLRLALFVKWWVDGLVVGYIGGISFGLFKWYTNGIANGLLSGVILMLNIPFITGIAVSFRRTFLMSLLGAVFFGIMIGGISLGVIIGAVLGFIGGLFFVFGDSSEDEYLKPEIVTIDYVRFSKINYLNVLKYGILAGVGIIAMGLVCWGAWAVSNMFFGLLFGAFHEVFSSVLETFVPMLSFCIKIAPFAGVLGIFLSFAIHVVMTQTSFIQINTPYKRFKSSMKVLYFSILQHWLLRYQLYRKGLLPFRLIHFLDEMTTQNLMESDGATWRFRHKIIQDYFADLWEKEFKEKSDY